MSRPIRALIPNADAPLNDPAYDLAALRELLVIEDFAAYRLHYDFMGNINAEPQARAAVGDLLLQIIRARETTGRRLALLYMQNAPQVESASTLSDSSVQAPEFTAKGGSPQS